MNKSKFLKKSLAALLAILMVAAMIPLSAAAAGDTVVVDINDDEGNLLNRDTITVTQGKLSGEDGAYDVALPYDQSSTDIGITTDREKIDFYSVDADGKETLVTSTVKVKDVPSGGSKTATIVLRSQTAEVGAEPVATYVFTVSRPNASGDTTVTSATYTYASGKSVTATPDGDTITFTKLPWGYTDSQQTLNGSPAKLVFTMADPHATATKYTFGMAGNNAATIPVGGEQTFTIEAQNGNTAAYKVKLVEDECLTGLTIDGEEAVKDTTDETGMTYKVIVDATNGSAPVKVTTKKGATGSTRFQYDFYAANTNWDSTYSNDTTLNTATASYKLRVADKETTPNFKTYTVNIEVRKNADPSVKSFIVYDGAYNETGVVAANGDMTAVLANGTTFPKANCTVNLLTKGKVTAATLNGDVAGTVSNDTSVSFSSVSLSATNTIAITAEDGTTRTYKLSLSPDPNKTTKPVVTEATLTVGTDTYTVTPSGDTITFEVPAAKGKTAINAELKKWITDLTSGTTPTSTASFSWKTTAHTTPTLELNSNELKKQGGSDPNFTYTDPVEGYFNTDKGYHNTAADGAPASWEETTVENTLTLTSDGDATKTYDVVFKVKDPEPGKRLENFKFYTATKQDKVTDEKTYTAKIVEADKKITIDKKLPFGLAGTENVVVEYKLSTGASLWGHVKTTSTDTANQDKVIQIAGSGWKTDGTNAPNTNATVTVNRLKDFDALIVADEYFTAGIDPNSSSDFDSSTKKIGGTAFDTWAKINASSVAKAHCALYELKVETEDASEATDILSLEEVDGQVVSLIDVENGTVEVVVPETYVTEGSEKEFDLTIKTAPLVSSVVVREANDTNIASAAPNADDVIEMLKAVSDGNGGYNLVSSDGKAIKKIVVTAENTAFKKVYTVTVSAKTLSDDNSLSGITVKGEAATEGEDNAWTVELPYGTDLETITADDVAATVADKAEAAVVKNENGTYTITVTAENQSKAEYTLTVTVADEPENPFEDVGDNWATDSIIKAAKLGWIQGKGNGKFDPKGEMTRAQFALIIARIKAGGNDAWLEIAGDYTTDVYDDVSANNDYMPAIAYVTEEGIMSGKGAGKFDPNGTITRQEAAKVMAIASGLEEIPGNTNYSDDASIAGWAKGYVNAVTENNIMNGMGAGFSPNVKLTREMGATILVRAFDKAEEPEVPAE